MKKTFGFILVAVLALSLFSACGGDKAPAAAGGGAASTAPSVSTPSSGPSNPLPISTTPVTLSFATNDNYYEAATISDELPVFKWIKEKTGVSIDWELTPRLEYGTAIQVRMAAGVNLPDIVNAPATVDSTLYGEDGMFIELSGLLDKYGENFDTYLAKYPGLEAFLKAPNGAIYGLSGINGPEEYQNGAYGWQIRKDWLDKLGLAEPETIEDWYNVLKAFKNGNPNGRNDPNTVWPITNDGRLLAMMSWGGAWGLKFRRSEGFSINTEGKVEYDYVKPEAKEMIKFIRRLYAEGLMDPESFTNSGSDLVSKAISNNVGASISWQEFCNGWNNGLKSTGIADAHWVQAKMPAGPNGYPGHMEMNSYIHTAKLVITRDCEDPDTAMRWLDHVLYNPVITRNRTIGVEGISYTLDAAGNPQLTDFVMNNPDGLGRIEAIRSIGGWCAFMDANPYSVLFKLGNDPEEIRRAEITGRQFVTRTDFAVPSQDEVLAIQRPLSDIVTYRDEALTKFIMGQEDVDAGWDVYVKRMWDIGLQGVLDVKQVQLDRLVSFGYKQ